MNNKLEEINNKIEKGYTNSNFFKVMIGISLLALMIGIIGFVYAEEEYKEEKFIQSYEINEFNNMVFHLDTNYYRTLDYTLTQTNYVRLMFGKIIDTGTGLTFKNIEIYDVYLKTGIIYKDYINNDIYLHALEHYLQNYNLIIKEKQIIITNEGLNAKNTRK